MLDQLILLGWIVEALLVVAIAVAIHVADGDGEW